MDHPSTNWSETPRPGLHDLWNAKLYEGADWTEFDNPKVSCTAAQPPDAIISWHDAKHFHKKRIADGEYDYHANAFIHCCSDDQKFDGDREGIWKKWEHFFEVASHFSGITGIDFSTNADFPEPLKRYQFHKMRAIEHGAIHRSIPVIPNARWGTPETWGYCFDGLPESSVLCIGVVGSGLKKIENRPVFEEGIRELVRQKKPYAIVVIGSTNYQIFRELEDEGIVIYQYDGETEAFFKMKGNGHV